MSYNGKRSLTKVKQYRDKYFWHRRIINEMKENKTIIKKILDGTFDKYLEKK